MAKLTGLIENNPKKGIDNPTTERLLKIFDNITLTVVPLPGQSIRHLPALTPVQTRILAACRRGQTSPQAGLMID